MNKNQKTQLKMVDVAVINPDPLRLRCERCGSIWVPNLNPGGRLYRDYWKCPNSCFSDQQVRVMKRCLSLASQCEHLQRDYVPVGARPH